MSGKGWTAEAISEVSRGYQGACVITAAAELELFDRMGGRKFTANEASKKLGCDLRGVTVLLDVLSAMKLLMKKGEKYEVPVAVKAVLTVGGNKSLLAMMQHQAVCLRKWSRLAEVVKTGQRAKVAPGVLGKAAEYAAFIEAMNNVSGPLAAPLVKKLGRLEFTHLLDVGGATGTYTIAFLKKYPKARATIFDLPYVLPQAKERLKAVGMAARVDLAGGDFYIDTLPKGADLIWLSAIVHQNSRAQNRELFAKCFAALESGGQLLVRDFLMEESRTEPVGGAFFAVNMLVATPTGGTFTVSELKEDMEAVGFTGVKIVHREPTMHSVIAARKK